jgi:hypothetical protein
VLTGPGLGGFGRAVGHFAQDVVAHFGAPGGQLRSLAHVCYACSHPAASGLRSNNDSSGQQKHAPQPALMQRRTRQYAGPKHEQQMKKKQADYL